MDVHEYVDLTLDDLAKVDRKNTVVTIAVSPIEVHGPHLPLGTDITVATGVRDRVLPVLGSRHPEITVLNLPPLYCGADALPYPGSLSVNAQALAGVLYDYSKGLSKQGFRYLIVFDNHGGPRHHLGIGHAADRVWKKYGFYLIDPFIEIYRKMVTHAPDLLAVTGLEPGKCGDDADNHAGTNETSLMMAVSPEYALKDYSAIPTSAPPRLRGSARAVDFLGRMVARLGGRRAGPDLMHLAEALAWTGEKEFLPYMGSPASASRERGEAMLRAHVQISVDLIEKALEGLEARPIPILEFLSFLRRLPE